MSDTKQDPLGNDFLSFRVIGDVLNLLCMYVSLKIFDLYLLKLDKAAYVLLIFNLFYLKDWPNVKPILFYTFVEFFILFHTFFIISFDRYKEYILCQNSFSCFSDALLTYFWKG